MPLGIDLRHRPAMVGEGEGTAVWRIDFLIQRHSESVADGSDPVFWFDGFGDDFFARLVCRAINGSSLDPAACQHAAECGRIMIPAGVLVDAGRTSELGADGDERGFEQTALVQIGNQRCHRPGKFSTQGRDAAFDLRMHVPTVGGDLNHANALFDQPARQQTTLTDFSHAVILAIFLAAQVKDVQLLALEKPGGLIVEFHVGFGPMIVGGFKELCPEFVGEVHAALETLIVGRERGVQHTDGRVGDRKRGKRGIEVAGIRGWFTDEETVRQNLAAPPEQVFGKRAHGRMNYGAALLVTALHDVGPLIVSAGGGAHAVDDRNFVSHLREALKTAAEFDGIGVRVDLFARPHECPVVFGIKGVEVGHAAMLEDVDQAFGFAVASTFFRQSLTGEKGDADPDSECGAGGSLNESAAAQVVVAGEVGELVDHDFAFVWILLDQVKTNINE